MGELSVVRWSKYGKDRLYVNAADGVRVGWVDLVSGAEHVERSEQTVSMREAVQAWREGQTATPVRCGEPPKIDHKPTVPVSVAVGAVPELTQPIDPSLSLPPDAGAPEPLSATPAHSPLAPAPEWTDLTANVAGQAAREQADAELAALRSGSRVGAFLARALDVKTDERAWRVGAGGEETVGSRLDKLEKRGWHVLHAVPVGDRGSDIDHVLIGPGGVFTLNTKTHPGGTVWVGKDSVRVNGHRTQYLRNSRHEAARAEALLSAAVGFAVQVRPALVFLTGSLFPNVTITKRPEDVLILDRMDIPGVFKRSKGRLTPEHIELVYEQARRSTTWRTDKPIRARRSSR